MRKNELRILFFFLFVLMVGIAEGYDYGSCDNLLSVLDNDTQFNYLRMEDITDNYLYYYLNDSVDQLSGITVKARTRLICDMEGDFGPLGIYIQDGTYCFIVSVGKDFVMVDYDNQQKFTWTDGDMFKASIWHVYRLTAKEGLLNVYVDNSSIGGPWTTQRTDYTNHLRFGCLWSRTYQGIMDWDYFYVAQGEETAPPAAPTWDVTLDMTDYPTNEGWSSVIGTGNDVSLFSSSGDEFLSSSVPDLSQTTSTSSTTLKILEPEITPGFTFQMVVTLLGVIIVLWNRKRQNFNKKFWRKEID